MFTSMLRRPAQSDKDAASAEAAWRAYVVTAERAQRSRPLADGCAAGRAWAAFLRLFRKTVSIERPAGSRAAPLHIVDEHRSMYLCGPL
jgi:hypothetical protein